MRERNGKFKKKLKIKHKIYNNVYVYVKMCAHIDYMSVCVCKNVLLECFVCVHVTHVCCQVLHRHWHCIDIPESLSVTSGLLLSVVWLLDRVLREQMTLILSTWYILPQVFPAHRILHGLCVLQGLMQLDEIFYCWSNQSRLLQCVQTPSS